MTTSRPLQRAEAASAADGGDLGSGAEGQRR